MADLDSIRSILYSKSIDPHDVKAYTGLHVNASGDLILSTPSLESYRVNNDPLYRYEGFMSARFPKEVDFRVLAYDTLEKRRYKSLRMKKPTQSGVSRIFDERFGCYNSPRHEPSRTIRVHTAPGYRLLVDQIPNQDQTMVPQRFNKLSPFVTERGNNPNTNLLLPESTA